ncbi:uncharacterized protein PG986_003903 [Apiospora aurea]|uniref:Uncharacterized protein n=1 Tax=Apiospora aurea TaxID=335848 RepID=A0ABR1QML7_9PEZI
MMDNNRAAGDNDNVLSQIAKTPTEEVMAATDEETEDELEDAMESSSETNSDTNSDEASDEDIIRLELALGVADRRTYELRKQLPEERETH